MTTGCALEFIMKWYIKFVITISLLDDVFYDVNKSSNLFNKSSVFFDFKYYKSFNNIN